LIIPTEFTCTLGAISFQESTIRVGKERSVSFLREVKTLKKQLERQKSAMAGRLRDIYENGHTDYIACILDAATFSDFVNRTEFFSSLVNADANMIEEINAKTEKLNDSQQLLHSKKGEIAQDRRQYEEKDRYLASLEEKRKGLLHEVKTERRQVSSSIIYLEHLSRQEEARMQAIIRSYQVTSHGK